MRGEKKLDGQLIEQIVTNGVGVVIIAYFIYRDNKYTMELIELMTELKDLIKKLTREDKDDEKN